LYSASSLCAKKTSVALADRTITAIKIMSDRKYMSLTYLNSVS